ncbi:MAG: hypothetical protein R3C28_09130 [Pirellulaceae bacterium]
MSVFRDHQLLAITIIAMLACHGMENATAQQSINYDDGQEHVLTDPVQQVVVSNGSLLDIRANVEHVEVDGAVLLHNGGQLGSMSPEKGITLRNGANATLSSGRVWGIEIDAATLTLDGGFVNYFDCNTIEVHNHSNFILESGGVGAADPGCRGLDVLDSNVMVNGGSTGGITWLAGASTANITSGTLTNIDNGTLYASDTSSITITSGLVTTPHDVVIRLDDSATLRLTGGEVDAFQGNGIFANHQSTVEIWAGVVRSNENSVVSVGGSSQLRIAGGTFELGEDIYPHINAAGESNVTIFGRDFNFPVSKPIEPLDGVITGTLADGSQVNWRYNRESTATITLLPFIPGDFNLDGVLNFDDIDAQAVAMQFSGRNRRL